MPDNGSDNEKRPVQGGPKDGPNGLNRMRSPRGVFGWIGLIALALLLATLVSQNLSNETEISISQFQSYVNGNKLKKIQISSGVVHAEIKQDVEGISANRLVVVKYPPEVINKPEFVDSLLKKCPSAEVKYVETNSLYLQILVNLVPWLLIALFVWFFVLRQLRATGGGAGMLGSFGRSRHRVSNRELTNITFNDVAGVEEAKEEVAEIIEFLKNPKKFQRLGGRIPRGVLLVGEPGCGKTLLAKAIAGEADVPFFSISGSDFVEMFVGVGASRVRDLFKQAKDNSPCIVFLDEIDAVGRRRGLGFNGGGHDEREQTLNAILVEMDGFDTSDQVIVIAATNREDVLDPALTRPGRFDRRVYVPLPDIKGRLEILKVHAKKVKLGAGVDLMRLARGTPMFSGAELAAIINEAALIATMANKDAIDMDDLEEARDKVRWGRANKSRKLDEKDRVMTAYHEAGHAILCHLLPDAEPLHKVSIIPRGQSLGQTFFLPEKDKYTVSRNQAKAQLQVAFGGRLAEEMCFGDYNSGAAMDIIQATRIARKMVCEWGMAEALGPIRYSPDERQSMFDIAQKDYSDQTAEKIDEEVHKLIDEALQNARSLLESKRKELEALSQALLKYETLDHSEVDRILRGEVLDKPSLTDILSNESVPPRKPDVSARPVEPRISPLPGGPMPHPGMG